ncbi:prenyltransferase/squalene oxidase repeat-containing protein [Nonomuraea gerenzanensis]|uniref:Uncharacterized protein n=1 Tax=Nonomuraea gerenzanensis TaxID=93944 RepID=A0A1M4E381_9ACTN|nr:hypothetical protein [Nonomuraea gerenzanensis]UBU15490.1 hypothetical protein LCN96_10850 [Nonomuraea gerenzanensis]SBO93252.1 hypothetical protein BN4615_P2766 [Nonomuraea gerenzanensis]
MNVNLSLIPGFLAGHGRVLDRRRYDLLVGTGDAAGVLAALEGYRNADGGYGWGLEPDLRSPESQPGAALHAFEAFAEAGPLTSPHAAALCDWLDAVTLPDGGLPFSLPLTVPAATAPWWTGGDSATSSLQITAITAAVAHQVAAHDPAVAGHPWLEKATRYCFETIRALEEPPHAYVLLFAVRFLDAVYDRPGAADLLKRLGALIPEDGRVPVAGGTENEALRPLDFAPFPGRPVRDLFEPSVIAADLVRLAGEQQDDGGWTVDYARISPAGSLEWRGAATVSAVRILRANELV